MSTSDRSPGEDPTASQFRPGWWLGGLTAPDRDAAGPVPRPRWADTVENAAAAWPALAPAEEAAAGQPAPHHILLRPFLARVREQLVPAALRLPAGFAEPGRLTDTYVSAVARQLAGLARPTVDAELAKPGPGDLAARLRMPAGLAAFLAGYPVLARLLGTATELSVEAGLELLARFAADRRVIVTKLLGGVDPGPAVAIEPGLGDRHQGGRSVTAVSFADGRTVIYKPANLGGHLAFQRVIDWLNARVPAGELRLPAAVARPGYGWVEFIVGRPLPRLAAAAEFYRREGVLLAALYATHACDMHHQNVIASGTSPVVIDVETIFHPDLPMPRTTAPDPAAEFLASSVLSTGLLPYVTVDEDGARDQSGMTGGRGHNMPRIDGEVIEPDTHEAAVIEGFRLGYDAIAAEPAVFAQLLSSCGDTEVRAVVRPTSGYAGLMSAATHPELLRDAADRDQALAVLREVSAHHPLWHGLADHEIADLWNGDIPRLTTRPARTDIWTSGGVRLPGQFGRTGLSCALANVQAMGEVHRRDQEWIISASLAARKPHGGHHVARAVPGPVTAAAAERSRLLAAACGLGDQIVASAIADREGPGRVNWLGLECVEDSQWMLLPMGAGLADGYLGVALFLAQLGELTGVDRYAETARQAVSALPVLLAAIGGRPELVAAIGCGGIGGLGGISYGLARMSGLLHDAELGRWATVAAELAATVSQAAAAPGWVSGSAGCLTAMVSVQAELGFEPAAALARSCADRLCELVAATDGYCGFDGDRKAGFAAGPAGIGWSLVRFAEAGAEPRYLAAGQLAARRALETSSPDDSPGWCSGAAGRLLARTCLPVAAEGLDEAAHLLAGRPVREDLSLCHGEAGVADVLSVLSAVTGSRTAYRAQRHRAGLLLDVVNRYTSVCGTPGGVPTPGLLNGLAGIGYGLLRLGFADRIPSALLLQASSSASRLTHGRPVTREESP